MKNVLIIEDEKPAADRLNSLVKKLGDVRVILVIDSVEDAVHWFNNNPSPDLVFCDIQLADGKSFSIFEQTNVECPIIFTTAFDQFAIKAFKLNSIDYLLKPINEEELIQSWHKFLTLNQKTEYSAEVIEELKKSLVKSYYKERFLIRTGEQFKFIMDADIAYLFSDGGRTFIVHKEGTQFLFDEKLDELELKLNPKYFHRISRKFIVRESSLSKISNYLNSRLIIDLHPHYNGDVIVSRERVSGFKNWLS